MGKKSKFEDIVSAKQTIIKDADYFKITYTPDEIIERKETYELYKELSIFTKYRKPNNVLLKGFPGSGKTVTINIIIKKLKNIFEDIDIYFDNCNDKSSSDILKNLLGGTAKGNIHSLMGQFLDSIEKDTLIILDEIDRSNKIESLLYYLSRPTEIKKLFNKNISLILISNNLRWEDSIKKDSIRSSLQLKTLVFNPYSEKEIKGIIKDRISSGFYDPKAILTESIDLIAKRVSKEKRGDCRVAIETVFNSAQIAESKKRNQIFKEDVQQALKIAINDSNKVLVSKLKDNQLLTLHVISSYEFNTIEDIHNNYIAAIKRGKLNIDNITKIMIFYILNYLDDLCLIEKSISTEMKDGIPRKSTKIEVQVDKEIVLDELIIRGLRLTRE